MPKASKATASERVRSRDTRDSSSTGRGYSVGFEKYTADADLAPLFAGLPDDRCQCPHWGYVIKGKVKFTYADGHPRSVRGGRCLLRTARSHADPLRGQRARGVPSDRGAPADDGGRDQEHGGRLVTAPGVLMAQEAPVRRAHDARGGSHEGRAGTRFSPPGLAAGAHAVRGSPWGRRPAARGEGW